VAGFYKVVYCSLYVTLYCDRQSVMLSKHGLVNSFIAYIRWSRHVSGCRLGQAPKVAARHDVELCIHA